MGREPKQYGCCGSLVIIGLIVSIVLVFNVILNRRQEGDRPASAPSPSASPPASQDRGGGSIRLTPADFGGYWPLEAGEILLMCEPADTLPSGSHIHYVLAVVEGKTYAVNGTAKGRADRRGWGDFDTLITEGRDPCGSFSIEATRFRLALVDRGLDLCR